MRARAERDECTRAANAHAAGSAVPLRAGCLAAKTMGALKDKLLKEPLCLESTTRRGEVGLKVGGDQTKDQMAARQNSDTRY